MRKIVFVIIVLLSVMIAGCNCELERIKCKTDENCPYGMVCGPKKYCVEEIDGGNDVGVYDVVTDVTDIKDIIISDLVNEDVIKDGQEDIEDIADDDIINNDGVIDILEMEELVDAGTDVLSDTFINDTTTSDVEIEDIIDIKDTSYTDVGYSDISDISNEFPDRCNTKVAKAIQGDGNEYIFKIKSDADGNIYIGGMFNGRVNFGTGEINANGIYYPFIAKFNELGSLIWSKIFESTGNAEVIDIGIGPDENIYVLINFSGKLKTDLGEITSNGGKDIELIKMNKSGDVLKIKNIGGSNDDESRSLAIWSVVGIYVIGEYRSSSINTDGQILSNSGGLDIFIIKLNNNLEVVESKSFGGSGDELGMDIALDSEENIIITGSFSSSKVNFGGSDLNLLGGNDIFIAKFDKNFNYKFSKSFGSINIDEGGYTISVDYKNNIFIAGVFRGPLDFGGGSLSAAGQYDGFIAKFDSNGNHVWSKGLGGNGEDIVYDSVVDYSGNIIVTGRTNSSSVGFGGSSFSNYGDNDIFIAMYDYQGKHLYSNLYGSSKDDRGLSVDFNPKTGFLIGGYFSGDIKFGDNNVVSTGSGTNMFFTVLPCLNNLCEPNKVFFNNKCSDVWLEIYDMNINYIGTDSEYDKPSCVVKDNKIYSSGGGWSQALNDFLIFDLDKWEWNKGPNYTGGTYGHASLVYKDNIWAIGGYTGYTGTSQVRYFDVNDNKWNTSTSLPWNEGEGIAAIVTKDNEYILACGGHINNGTMSNKCARYKFGGSWETMPNLPFGIRYHSLFYLNDNVCFAGGLKDTSDKGIKDIYCLDERNGKWNIAFSLSDYLYRSYPITLWISDTYLLIGPTYTDNSKYFIYDKSRNSFILSSSEKVITKDKTVRKPYFSKGSVLYDTFDFIYVTGFKKSSEADTYMARILICPFHKGCGAYNTDQDNDGVLGDGDLSGIVGDKPCKGGQKLNCDDNCPSVANPDQLDSNNNGIGDVCEQSQSQCDGISCDDGKGGVCDYCKYIFAFKYNDGTNMHTYLVSKRGRDVQKWASSFSGDYHQAVCISPSGSKLLLQRNPSNYLEFELWDLLNSKKIKTINFSSLGIIYSHSDCRFLNEDKVVIGYIDKYPHPCTIYDARHLTLWDISKTPEELLSKSDYGCSVEYMFSVSNIRNSIIGLFWPGNYSGDTYIAELKINNDKISSWGTQTPFDCAKTDGHLKYYPTVSPDGSMIAFDYNRPSGYSGPMDVKICNIGESTAKLFISCPFSNVYVYYPLFIDNLHILFTCDLKSYMEGSISAMPLDFSSCSPSNSNCINWDLSLIDPSFDGNKRIYAISVAPWSGNPVPKPE